jgi:excisionase family DNA binding protein
MSTPMDKLLLTPDEAAQVLGIGRSKVYELLASRQLGSVKIGSCRRISADALRAYVLTLTELAS